VVGRINAERPWTRPPDIARIARKHTLIPAAIATKHAHSGGCASDRVAASPLPSDDAYRADLTTRFAEVVEMVCER
jgi:hypothetical protein